MNFSLLSYSEIGLLIQLNSFCSIRLLQKKGDNPSWIIAPISLSASIHKFSFYELTKLVKQVYIKYYNKKWEQ